MKKHFSLILCLLLFLFNKVGAQNKSWSLEECIDFALKNNLQIKRTTLTNDLNEKSLEDVFANRRPRVSASGGENVNFGRSIDPSSNQFVITTFFNNNFGLSGSLPLFNGFQNDYAIKQSRLNYQAGGYDIEKSKNDILLSILGFYLQVLLFSEQEQASKIQIQNSIEQLKKSELQLNQGMITEDVYYKMKSQVASDEQNAITIVNQLKLAKLNLCQQMQIPFTDEFQIEKINAAFDSLDLDNSSSQEIYTIAEKNMPQIKASHLNVKSSSYGIKLSKSAYFPSLSLNGGVNTRYSSNNKEYTFIAGQFQSIRTPFKKQLSTNLSEYISLNLTVPIYNAKHTKISVSRAKINLAIAEVNKQTIENQLRLDIENSHNNYLTATKKYNTAKSNLEARELSYRIIEKRYNAGYLNIYNYLEEKNALTKAQLDFLQSKYEFIFREKILDFYKGNLKY